MRNCPSPNIFSLKIMHKCVLHTDFLEPANDLKGIQLFVFYVTSISLVNTHVFANVKCCGGWWACGLWACCWARLRPMFWARGSILPVVERGHRLILPSELQAEMVCVTPGINIYMPVRKKPAEVLCPGGMDVAGSTWALSGRYEWTHLPAHAQHRGSCHKLQRLGGPSLSQSS